MDGINPREPASVVRPPSHAAGRVAPQARRPDPRSTVRRLKGVAVVATAIAAGAFGGLVVNHAVGSTAVPVASQPGGGLGAADAASRPLVTPVDPFFDPAPGGGGNVQAAPAFGPRANAPVFRSGGS